MQRLLIAVITILASINFCSAQEFTNMRSNDLLKDLRIRFIRECGQSPFLANYQEENSKFAKGTKSVHIKRGEFYKKEIVIEKGFIIAKTESTPFEKVVENFNIDVDGKLYRSSKRTSRMNGEEVLMEETDITSFAYGDTLYELHNYHATPGTSRCDFNYSYIFDTLGLAVQKIANTHINHIDTTHYEYDSLRRVKREILGNKTVLNYDYTPSGEVATIKRQSQGSEELHLTTFTYDRKNRLTSISLQESYTHTELRLRYDEQDKLVWFSCKTNDGEEISTEECSFEYDEKGYISKDCSGFSYKYKYDKRGNWIKCDISKNGKRVERITREFKYEKTKN